MTERKTSIGYQLLADLGLLIITVIWGSTFFMVDKAVDTVNVFVFLAFRFTIAFVVLLLIFGYFLFKTGISWSEIWRGIVIGVFLFMGYSFQTFGMQQGTEPGKAAFITGLYVVLVPVFSTFLLKKIPHVLSWLGVIVAFVGIGLLSLENGFHINLSSILGDIFIIIGAFGYAFHIISTDKFVEKYHFIPLTIGQIGTVAILSWIGSLAFWNDSYPIEFNDQVIFAMIFTGIAATALILAIQTFVQKKTSPTHVAVIFAMEPVFGALFAIWFVSETMLPRQWGGCVLILASMIFQQLIDIYLTRKTDRETTQNSYEQNEINHEEQLNK